MKPPLWEAPPAEPPRDILAGERARPRRWWRPGGWLSGRLGMAVLAVFVAGGLGWVLFSKVDPGPAGPAGRSGAAWPAHPESGRDLTPAERAFAAGYGQPLFLGSGGRPVVRLEVTGEVRELTPVELDFGSSLPYAGAGYGGVVWTPGPRGWGLWWKDDAERRALESAVRFPRSRWREKQHAELSHAALRVSQGLGLVESLDLELWRPGIGPVLAGLMGELEGRHPVLEYGHWGAVPGQWLCDSQLESNLNQGLTQGCPAGEYLDRLEDAWVRLGVAADLLRGIGRLSAEMDAMSAEDRHQSALPRAQAYLLADLLNAVRELERSLQLLWDESGASGLPIGVTFRRGSGAFPAGPGPGPLLPGGLFRRRAGSASSAPSGASGP